MRGGGTINADGFGIGWLVGDPSDGGVARRYRRDVPMWSDAYLPGLAASISSSAILAAARNATAGMPVTETACAPFVEGVWMFSHNGALADHSRARKALVEQTLDVPEAGAPVDSALLFGVAVSAWVAGADLGAGLVACVQASELVGGGRLSFLAVDGERVAATAYGDPLFVLETGAGVLVASEPLDDDPSWRTVPDGSLLVGDRTGIDVHPLPR